jgi:hypothetical protein
MKLNDEKVTEFCLPKQEYLKANTLITEENKTKARNFIFNILNDKEILFVFDHTEEPLHLDNTKFIFELATLMENIKGAKILITTRKLIGKLPYNIEKSYSLKPLPKETALQLLISQAPRQIDNNEIQGKHYLLTLL